MIGDVTRETPTHDILKALQSWGNSVQFVCYERQQGRLTQDDAWLEMVGARIIAAADELLRRRREDARCG